MIATKSKANRTSNAKDYLLDKNLKGSVNIYQNQSMEKNGKMPPPEIIQVLSDSSCPYIKCTLCG